MVAIENRPGDDRAARYRAVVFHALERLSQGDDRSKTLHRLRTHLRRLQAYLELVGEASNAKVMADCVSRLSPLRTLHVFERYLSRADAPRSDLRLVRKRIRKRLARLRRRQVYREIDRLVREHALPPTPTLVGWMANRLAELRQANMDGLRTLVQEAQAKPKRKRLHQLRLKIKSVRYQEEWALGRPGERPDMVGWLKHAQSVLGEYEERAQFRRLARKLALKSVARVEQDWRRARKRARVLPAHLAELLEGIARGRVRLLGSRSMEGRRAVGFQ
jgi:CHAD domain-containing protein